MEPLHDLLKCRCIRGPGSLVALGPALHLPLHVAFGFAESLKADGLVVDGVEFVVHIQQVLAQRAHLIRREFESLGEVLPQDDPPDALHHVEGAPHDGFIFRIDQRLGTIGEDRVEGREDPVFPAHVMGGLGLPAEGRPPQHKLCVSDLDEVGEVRIPARELFHHEIARQARDAVLQELFNHLQIELFALPYLCGLVGEIHVLLLLRFLLSTPARYVSTRSTTNAAYFSTLTLPPGILPSLEIPVLKHGLDHRAGQFRLHGPEDALSLAFLHDVDEDFFREEFGLNGLFRAPFWRGSWSPCRRSRTRAA